MDALAAMKFLLKMQQAMGVRNSDVDRTHDSLFDQRVAVTGHRVDMYGTEYHVGGSLTRSKLRLRVMAFSHG
jgi:hypothetical protein